MFSFGHRNRSAQPSKRDSLARSLAAFSSFGGLAWLWLFLFVHLSAQPSPAQPATRMAADLIAVLDELRCEAETSASRVDAARSACLQLAAKVRSLRDPAAPSVVEELERKKATLRAAVAEATAKRLCAVIQENAGRNQVKKESDEEEERLETIRAMQAEFCDQGEVFRKTLASDVQNICQVRKRLASKEEELELAKVDDEERATQEVLASERKLEGMCTIAEAEKEQQEVLLAEACETEAECEKVKSTQERLARATEEAKARLESSRVQLATIQRENEKLKKELRRLSRLQVQQAKYAAQEDAEIDQVIPSQKPRAQRKAPRPSKKKSAQSVKTATNIYSHAPTSSANATTTSSSRAAGTRMRSASTPLLPPCHRTANEVMPDQSPPTMAATGMGMDSRPNARPCPSFLSPEQEQRNPAQSTPSHSRFFAPPRKTLRRKGTSTEAGATAEVMNPYSQSKKNH